PAAGDRAADGGPPGRPEDASRSVSRHGDLLADDAEGADDPRPAIVRDGRTRSLHASASGSGRNERDAIARVVGDLHVLEGEAEVVHRVDAAVVPAERDVADERTTLDADRAAIRGCVSGEPRHLA